MSEAVPPQGESASQSAESVETNVGEKEAQERRYTGDELELIVRDRLLRAEKKHAKERAEWTTKQSETVKPKGNANIEEELRGKLTQYEEKEKTLAQKLGKYRDNTLRASIERELNAQNCVDPEVVIDHFLARNKVELDDDDNVVVNNATGKLSDLVGDYLSKKPHLAKPSQVTGAGTKGPKAVTATPSGNFAEMSVEEMEKQLGIVSKPKVKVT